MQTFVLNAPFWLGGYQGIDTIDVCSRITGISTKHLVMLPEMCDETIQQEIHSYTIVFITIIVVSLIFYSMPIVKYLYEKRLEEKEKQRKHEKEVLEKQISTVEKAMNKQKGQLAYQKGKWTKERHACAISTLETIETVMNTKGKENNRMLVISTAMDKFREWWSPPKRVAMLE